MDMALIADIKSSYKIISWFYFYLFSLTVFITSTTAYNYYNHQKSNEYRMMFYLSSISSIFSMIVMIVNHSLSGLINNIENIEKDENIDENIKKDVKNDSNESNCCEVSDCSDVNDSNESDECSDEHEILPYNSDEDNKSMYPFEDKTEIFNKPPTEVIIEQIRDVMEFIKIVFYSNVDLFCYAEPIVNKKNEDIISSICILSKLLQGQKWFTFGIKEEITNLTRLIFDIKNNTKNTTIIAIINNINPEIGELNDLADKLCIDGF